MANKQYIYLPDGKIPVGPGKINGKTDMEALIKILKSSS